MAFNGLMPLIWSMEGLEYQRDTRAIHRGTRDFNHPFDLSPNDFRILFRVTHEIVDELIEELGPYLQRIRSYGISVEEQVYFQIFVLNFSFLRELDTKMSIMCS